MSQGIHRLEAQPWTTPACQGFQAVPLSLPLVFFPASGWAIARCSLRVLKDLPRNLLVPFSLSPWYQAISGEARLEGADLPSLSSHRSPQGGQEINCLMAFLPQFNFSGCLEPPVFYCLWSLAGAPEAALLFLLQPGLKELLTSSYLFIQPQHLDIITNYFFLERFFFFSVRRV